MRKFLCFIVACLCMSPAFADDGGTSYPEDWTYGNIYVKEPNKSIALEKEYMYVTGDRINAVFSFRNTTDSTVVVPCAFPVVVNIPIELDGGRIILGDSYHTEIDMTVWKIVLNKKDGFLSHDDFWQLLMTGSELLEYDKKLRVMTYPDYIAEYELQGGIYEGCKIEQDGNPIELKNVGIETNVEIFDTDTNERVSGEVELVLHFYHELKFQPNTLSKVSVDYSVNMSGRCYDGCSYTFYYDISTGATWKDGVIGSFVMLTDYEVGKTEGLYKTQLVPYSIFSARNYKPVDRFRFWGSDVETNKMYKRNYPGETEYYGVDTLTQIALRGINEIEAVVIEQQENFLSEPLQPADILILADVVKGLEEHLTPSFVNGRFGFKIAEPCVGPFIANGYVDSKLSEKNKHYFYYEVYEGREPQMSTLQKDYVWERYSRIKSATLKSIDEGWSETLYLNDRFPAYPYEMSSNFNDGWYGSNAVHRVRVLRPGTYEFEVNSVWPGAQSDSVGLSHVWFYPFSADLLSILDEDAKSPMPLFTDVMNKVVQIQLSDEEPDLGDIDLGDYFDETEDETDTVVVEKKRSEPRSVDVEPINKEPNEIHKPNIVLLGLVIAAVLGLAVFAIRAVVRRKKKQ
ncbi:MAG: hypothetical protein J6Y82_12275 [Bacteroidales bacterium]|nr:hypothetical protein [Bacteroidales bacterium]